MAMVDRKTPLESQTFELLGDRTLPPVLENAMVRNCTFASCHYGATALSPRERRVIRTVRVQNCKARGNTSLGPVLVEDVVVDGLMGSLVVDGAAYNRVTLEGKCGRIM